jgi:hypothetical protein
MVEYMARPASRADGHVGGRDLGRRAGLWRTHRRPPHDRRRTPVAERLEAARAVTATLRFARLLDPSRHHLASAERTAIEPTIDDDDDRRWPERTSPDRSYQAAAEVKNEAAKGKGKRRRRCTNDRETSGNRERRGR